MTRDATAANLNALKQDGRIRFLGRGGIQAIGRKRRTSRRREPRRSHCSTVRATSPAPVRVDSKGDDGRVTQTNSVDSDATAANLNLTEQDADQDQRQGQGLWLRRWRHPGYRPGGQEQSSPQVPSRLRCVRGVERRTLRCGSTARVTTVLSVSRTASTRMRRLRTWNALKQDADQDQSGSGGTQAIGQEAKNEQDAFAASRRRSWVRATGTPRCVSTARATAAACRSRTVSSRMRRRR